MARGRMIATTHKCGDDKVGTFQIIGVDGDNEDKVILRCDNCGYKKTALKEKCPDTVEDISVDVAATINTASPDVEEVVAAEVDQAEIVSEDVDDNMSEVVMD